MKLKDFNNEIEARQHFGEKPFDKEPKKMTKEEIELNMSKIEQLRRDEMLDKQKEDIKEKIRKVGIGKRWAMQAFHNGYDQAKIDILKELNK